MVHRHRARGTGTLEVLFIVAILMIAGATSAGLSMEWRDRSRGLAAVRLLASQVRLARAYAVKEGTHVGLVFRRRGDGSAEFRLHRDDNGNGVRQGDVQSGTDPAVGEPIRLEEWFAATTIAVPRDLPPIDAGPSLVAGSDPVRLSGGGAILSCGPSGTTTSGTVYVAGARREAFAVRVLGATGRVRLFEYSAHNRRWDERW